MGHDKKGKEYKHLVSSESLANWTGYSDERKEQEMIKTASMMVGKKLKLEIDPELEAHAIQKIAKELHDGYKN